MEKKKLIVIFIGIFLCGAIVDRGITLLTPIQQPLYHTVRQKGFTYISPLLYCETPQQLNNQKQIELSSALETYINNQDKNHIQNISVYFRIPDTGEWFVIHGDERYTPASLLKVPILIAYYKQAESDPTILTKKLVYQGDTTGAQNIQPTQEIIKGQSYTIDELINRMITYSDNRAMTELMNNISKEAFDRVFDEIDMGHLDYANTDNFMTVQKYASFFRILYNASYLNRDMSEKALALLTKTNFSDGLLAGIPHGIAVAHKFGERAYEDSEQKQLHECGIVYAPNHPYLLCIMTKGDSFSALATVIKTISKKVYTMMAIRQ